MSKINSHVGSVFLCSVALVVAVGASGCALFDTFAPRATDYNYQTADAKSGTIILNIVRAAYAQLAKGHLRGKIVLIP